jgi:putative hydrolase of the HAD superfamily
MTRAVFFDAGHTLLFAYPDLGTVYAETTARFGVRLAPQAFAETFVPVFKSYTREYASQGAASDAQDYAMWREITRRIHAAVDGLHRVEFDPWFEALYVRFGESDVWRLYDDVEPTLTDLRKRGLRLAIVSNWDTRLRKICVGLGVDRLVDFIVISAEAGVRKPDPRIFEEALRRAEVSAKEAIHVGDLPDEDIEGARRAGIRGVLIDRQKRITPNEKLDGMTLVRSLAELEALL